MNKRSTFDLLDASIPEFDFESASIQEAHAYYRSLPDKIRTPSYMREWLTDPVKWELHEPLDWQIALNWSEYRYSAVTAAADIDKLITSTDPGIYIFFIRPDNLICGFPRFPLYVGISNERNTKRPLRERLKEYLLTNAVAIKKRGNVEQFLQLYYPVLSVAYALVPRSSAELRAMEEKFHGFIYPIFGIRDYPIDIKTLQKQKAWG